MFQILSLFGITTYAQLLSCLGCWLTCGIVGGVAYHAVGEARPSAPAKSHARRTVNGLWCPDCGDLVEVDEPSPDALFCSAGCGRFPLRTVLAAVPRIALEFNVVEHAPADCITRVGNAICLLVQRDGVTAPVPLSELTFDELAARVQP